MGRAPERVQGHPQKQNLNFRFTKYRKAVFRIYAVHIQALTFPVCVTNFKRK